MIKFASSLGFVLFTNAIESILLSSLVSFRRVLSLSGHKSKIISVS